MPDSQSNTSKTRAFPSASGDEMPQTSEKTSLPSSPLKKAKAQTCFLDLSSELQQMVYSSLLSTPSGLNLTRPGGATLRTLQTMDPGSAHARYFRIADTLANWEVGPAVKQITFEVFPDAADISALTPASLAVYTYIEEVEILVNCHAIAALPREKAAKQAAVAKMQAGLNHFIKLLNSKYCEEGIPFLKLTFECSGSGHVVVAKCAIDLQEILRKLPWCKRTEGVAHYDNEKTARENRRGVRRQAHWLKLVTQRRDIDALRMAAKNWSIEEDEDEDEEEGVDREGAFQRLLRRE